jgi:hypothetical protein
MRPLGLSNSSPRRRYVGHVAVQKPQWTHDLRIDSEVAISGSESWEIEKFVCIDHAIGRIKTDHRDPKPIVRGM